MTTLLTNQTSPLVTVEKLIKYFPVTKGILFRHKIGVVHAVDGVSFQISAGETLGLVGESGCGKSTVGRTILGLYKATEGHVEIAGMDVGASSGKAMMEIRRKTQMIFQDPFASLNPRWTVNSIVSEPIRIHNLITGKKSRADRVVELLELVGLSRRDVNRFPHEFSGGQRQRIGIARALASQPLFIVCDEPIASLDVSIQAQVVNLLEELQEKFGITYLFIAHDLSMVRHICKRVAVMYLGIIMELAERDEIYENPQHPYTQALLSAVPVPDPEAARQRTRVVLKGDVPSPIKPPSGCRFHTRCPIAKDYCAIIEPAWREVSKEHWVYCHEVEPRVLPSL